MEQNIEGNLRIKGKMLLTDNGIEHPDIVGGIILKVETDVVTGENYVLMPIKVLTTGDVKIDTTDKGLIQTASNNTKWLRTVTNTGISVNVQVASSPEIPIEERLKRIKEKNDKIEELKKKSKKTDLESRINLIENILNIQ